MTAYARILDISGYWKTAPDWTKIKANFDAVIIRAGIGQTMDVYLPGYVTAAVQAGIPYGTYHIPAPVGMDGATSVESQAAIYLGWPGVRDAVLVLDIEPPRKDDPRMISATEAQKWLAYIDVRHKQRPWWYSNADCVSRLAWPGFLVDYRLWAAQYLYDQGTQNQLYTTFSEFLKEHLPPTPWVKGSIYERTLIAWQFTKKGDAQVTASRTDPAGDRVMDADYSISTIDKADFLALMGATKPPTMTLEERVLRLEKYHGLA